MSQIVPYRSLGVCWLVYGILRLAAALGLIFFSATATVMFGALLGRVADPFTLMDAFHIFYVLAIALCIVTGVLGIVAGIALMTNERTGRRLAILAGLLALSDLPLGIALGTYTLIAFLAPRSPARETSLAP